MKKILRSVTQITISPVDCCSLSAVTLRLPLDHGRTRLAITAQTLTSASQVSVLPNRKIVLKKVLAVAVYTSCLKSILARKGLGSPEIRFIRHESIIKLQIGSPPVLSIIADPGNLDAFPSPVFECCRLTYPAFDYAPSFLRNKGSAN